MKDKELLDLIKENYLRIKPKTCHDFFKYRDKEIPCLPTLKKLFGMTYNEILLKAGISEDDLNFVRRDKEQYLEKLKEISEKLGYVPSLNEFIRLGYSPQVLTKFYGSYENAAKIVNTDYRVYKKYKKCEKSKEELLKEYIDFSKKIGKVASFLDCEMSEELSSMGSYYCKFGNMENLKKEAGFEIGRIYKRKYEKQNIIDKLVETYLKKGKRLTVKELRNQNDFPSYTTILHNFKTTKINEVWEEIESNIINMSKN